MQYFYNSCFKNDIFSSLGEYMRDFKTIIKTLKIYLADGKKHKVFDKDVALALSITQAHFATIKKRNSTPYAHILEFCKNEELSCRDVFFD